jgi:ABC-type Mn2+/Zn2+ transport system ATPase subunit
MSALVSFDRVALGYGRRTVLSGLTFDIPAGDFLGLGGPNGAGKTTVLRALLGTLRPLSGSIQRDPDLRIGYVPQSDRVEYGFPLQVLDVVLMGRYRRMGLGRRPGREDRARARAALAHVGIAELADQSIATLSGGQKQRMLIARALVGEPNLLVLDEPTTGMDLFAAAQTLGLVRALHEQDRLAVLMVSHALNEVANYVERIALVAAGGFRIGTVSEVFTEPALTRMYGVPVDVDSLNGHRVVVVRREPAARTSPAAAPPEQQTDRA